MGTYMDGEGATLDEALITVTPSADVGTVIGVYAVVSDEVGLAIELLWARGPGAGELLCVLKGSDRSSSISSHGPTAGTQRRSDKEQMPSRSGRFVGKSGLERDR